jgi:hypothetical protein
MTALSEEFVRTQRNKNVFPIVGRQIDFMWELIWPLFREVPGFLDLYDEGWTYKNLKMGHLQIWAYSDTEIRGMVLTRINVFPKCKVLDIMTISGVDGLQFMQELDDVFEVLAEQQGCKFMSSSVRPGFERIFIRNHEFRRQSSSVIRPVGLRRKS